VCGDVVEAVPESPRWRVTAIAERSSVLTRTSPLGKPQVLAANIDRVLVVASICSPAKSGVPVIQTVVLTGPSGAGKTSVAMKLNPRLDLAVGALNQKTSRGRHTTVAARLLHLWGDTWMMDTPGLRAFSIEHIPAGELWQCFPEFRGLEPCHYRNCLHDSEPGCPVRDGVASGLIDRERYDSYLKLLGEIREGRPG
jgi:putative ribosome biogenesis GTPase RsgA